MQGKVFQSFLRIHYISENVHLEDHTYRFVLILILPNAKDWTDREPEQKAYIWKKMSYLLLSHLILASMKN